MPDKPETTVADYLRVLRQRRRYVLAVAIVCGAAALVASALQTPRYEATSSISVRDPNTDPGTGSFSTVTPLQLAASHAPRVTRNAVVESVRKKLRSPLSVDSLRGLIEVTIDPNSNLVEITAKSRYADEAARLATEFARSDSVLTNLEARRVFALQARGLQRRLKRIGATKDPTSRAVSLDRLLRLQSLSTVAQPVVVSQTAQVPGSPTSPKPVRNTAIALIFGLLLGIALAYAREALDRPLRQQSDVSEIFPEPVVGLVRGRALGHGGAARDEQDKRLGRLEPMDEEAFRIVRQNVSFLGSETELRTIAVTSSGAQEGKSTVAACLAVAIAASGKQTLLVGCDLRRPVLASRLGTPGAPGLADFLMGRAEPNEIVHPVAVPSEANGASAHHLACIAAGTPPAHPADVLGSERFRTFLAQVSQVYDVVILDCPPLLTVADTLEIVPHVDAVLMCVRLHQTTRDDLQSAREALARLPERPTGIVLTDVREAGGGYYGYYDYYAPERVAAGA
jgi:receptor protein-tyrosine kinase/non-specific protein-tyrosine kinase